MENIRLSIGVLCIAFGNTVDISDGVFERYVQVYTQS
jgi:hypothetical protein